MPNLKNYYRPGALEEALEILAAEGPGATLLAGGTWLIPRLEETETVVDLQDCELDAVSISKRSAALGAMVTLEQLVTDSRLPALLRDTARLEGPNTFRQQATIGGVIAGASPTSELLAALLVHDAEVTLARRAGAESRSLASFLASEQRAPAGAILTGVSLQLEGATAHERVARTPIDEPIVAALARLTPAGEIRLAVCGMGETPLLVDPAAVDDLPAQADFRGSAKYRQQMASLLCSRVLKSLSGSS